MKNSRVMNDAIGEGFKIKTTIRTLVDVNAFSVAHKLAMDIYKLSSLIPSDDKHSILGKLKRVSSAISADLSEQIERDEKSASFVKRGREIASKLVEVKTWLLLANQSGYMDNSTYLELQRKYQKLGLIVQSRYFTRGTTPLFD